MGIPVPLECLQEILQFLQDDLKSLYATLFVDKLWCINVIPILYKNPFVLLNQALFTTRNFNDAFEIHGEKILLLLDIYLSHLTLQQRLEWEEKGIMLTKNVEPLLFDYLSYLRILPIPEVRHAILLWCNKNYNIRNHRNFIEIELNKLFFTKCKNINTIMLDESSQLPELENLLPNFHNLNFICSKLFDTSILEKIIPYCDKIKVLSILRFGNKTTMNDKFIIPKIINKSKSLEKFYWESIKNYDESFITKSLENHINTLTHIEIYNNFTFHIINLISKCFYLKKLRLSKNFLNNFPQFINDDSNDDNKFIDITPFINPNCYFPYLQELFFGFIPKISHHFDILLRNTNNSLKILGTNWLNSINFLDLYCENLNFLYLKLSFKDFIKFFNLKKLPNSLTKLIFISSSSNLNNDNDININDFLFHLGNILPINIKFIHLGMFYKFFSIDYLSKFFLNCHDILSFLPLELILPFNIYINNNHHDDDYYLNLNLLIKSFFKQNVLSKNTWILFLYFYLKDCRKCSSCNGRLLDEENPIEPFKEIIIIKHCSCYKHHIEPFILRELQDGEDEENVV
ncbi:unnamed protein product [Rhizophagus irregularis]|uniref:F-box domain-containing protein n=1 Tax=Rhizophagus irregularis TaxID=588596 RepID=A0A915ZQJ5_9GLOM|nr:unnamed protein product [Rhizophagus irregularis]CAB5383529.1 unnamed protein product [Rhizophagus irregularis]